MGRSLARVVSLPKLSVRKWGRGGGYLRRQPWTVTFCAAAATEGTSNVSYIYETEREAKVETDRVRIIACVYLDFLRVCCSEFASSAH